MTQRLSRFWLAAVLAVGAAGAVQAGSCGPAGCPVGGAPTGIHAAAPYGAYGAYEFGYGAWNRAWLYPDGGFTLYPGEPGSCIQGHSDYSHVNWIVAPAVNAQRVLDKLQTLGIPLVPPETTYLGKDPYAADHAKLPTPRGWTKDEPKGLEKRDGEKVRPIAPPADKAKPDSVPDGIKGDKVSDEANKPKDLIKLPADDK